MSLSFCAGRREGRPCHSSQSLPQGWAQGCHHWSLEVRDGRNANLPTLAHEGPAAGWAQKLGPPGAWLGGWVGGGNLLSKKLLPNHMATRGPKQSLPSQLTAVWAMSTTKKEYTHTHNYTSTCAFLPG